MFKTMATRHDTSFEVEPINMPNGERWSKLSQAQQALIQRMIKKKYEPQYYGSSGLTRSHLVGVSLSDDKLNRIMSFVNALVNNTPVPNETFSRIFIENKTIRWSGIVKLVHILVLNLDDEEYYSLMGAKCTMANGRELAGGCSVPGQYGSSIPQF